MNENELATIIIGCAIEVHKQLGPGLLESAYEACLHYELSKTGLRIQKQQALPVVYKEIQLEHGYRVDLLVYNKVIIEIKAVEALTDVHTAQVLTYLKPGNYKPGLLFNFNTPMLKSGIRQIIH